MQRRCSVLRHSTIAAAALVFAAVMGLSSRAAACTYGISAERVAVPRQPTEQRNRDKVAPKLFDVALKALHRGTGPMSQGPEDGVELFVTTSCDDRGSMVLWVAAEDNETDFADLRYKLEVMTGISPLHLPSGALESIGEDELWFSWQEAREEAEKPLEFELRVIAVDNSGNESEPLYLEVVHPGGSEPLSSPSDGPLNPTAIGEIDSDQGLPAACSTPAAGLTLTPRSSWFPAWGLIALAVLRRRRR